LKGTTYQNRNIPAVDKDVEAVVSNILSSKFPGVVSFFYSFSFLKSIYQFIVSYALIWNCVMIDEFNGDLWAPLSMAFEH
jgi:hypothetical protein